MSDAALFLCVEVAGIYLPSCVLGGGASGAAPPLYSSNGALTPVIREVILGQVFVCQWDLWQRRRRQARPRARAFFFRAGTQTHRFTHTNTHIPHHVKKKKKTSHEDHGQCVRRNASAFRCPRLFPQLLTRLIFFFLFFSFSFSTRLEALCFTNRAHFSSNPNTHYSN